MITLFLCILTQLIEKLLFKMLSHERRELRYEKSRFDHKINWGNRESQSKLTERFPDCI